MALTQDGKQKLANKIQGILRESAAKVSAKSIDVILENTPKEIPGRMQAAWLNALQKLDIFQVGADQYAAPVISKHLSEAAQEFDNSWKYGFSDTFDQPLRIIVKLLNVLEFASTVEYGGPIEVGVFGNVGPKEEKAFPGQLDSPRKSSGRGMLRWIDESGTEHMQSQDREMTGSNSIAKSIPAIRAYAKTLGFQ